jgi:hypothetical protein
MPLYPYPLFLPIKAGNGMKVGHELMKQFLLYQLLSG